MKSSVSLVVNDSRCSVINNFETWEVFQICPELVTWKYLLEKGKGRNNRNERDWKREREREREKICAWNILMKDPPSFLDWEIGGIAFLCECLIKLGDLCGEAEEGSRLISLSYLNIKVVVVKYERSSETDIMDNHFVFFSDP